MAGGGLTDILRAKIKANLKTEVKDAYDQTLKDMDEIIFLGGNDKGATGTPNFEMNKSKEDVGITKNIEDNSKLFQSFPKTTGATESELAMKIQEL